MDERPTPPHCLFFVLGIIAARDTGMPLGAAAPHAASYLDPEAITADRRRWCQVPEDIRSALVDELTIAKAALALEAGVAGTYTVALEYLLAAPYAEDLPPANDAVEA